MAEKKKWIKNVVENMHKGAMTEAAEHEGVSNSGYIREHEHDSGKAGKRARLAKTLEHLSHNHHKKMASHKIIMHSMYGEG